MCMFVLRPLCLFSSMYPAACLVHTTQLHTQQVAPELQGVSQAAAVLLSMQTCIQQQQQVFRHGCINFMEICPCPQAGGG